MTASCEQLAAFVDGELSAEEAEAFRQHLAGCADCQAGLEDQVQASLAVSSAADAQQKRRGPFQPIWARPRVRVMALGAGVAALIGILVVGSWRSGRPLEDPLMLAQAETRPMEGRLGYPGADRYRKLATMRGGPEHGAGPDLRVMAELQDRGDFRGVATAYLLAGDPERAEAYLDQVPRSPDVDSDRALAALGRGDLERALGLLDGALAAAPDLLRAHWNRGVVLRAMDLQLAAAAEFQHVAQKGEPGWSDEARQLAEGLRAGAETRRKSWLDMNAAGMSLALEGKPLPPAMVARNPGLARLYLYHAVRAAMAPEEVLRLMPLAESLDQAFGGHLSSEYLQAVSRADFTKRAPLSETYRDQLAAKMLMSGAEAEAYLDRLRRSGEKDMLLGAILLLRIERQHIPELESLVQASGDPAWYRAPLVKVQVAEDLARGDAARAEQRLLEAIDECRRAKLENRCVALQEVLSDLYNKLDRRREAMGPAREALAVARRTEDWFQEDLLVADLMTAARLSHEPALSRAYLDEYLQREPDDCMRRAEYHYARALLSLEALDVASARREVQEARGCEASPTLFEAAVYGDLLRFGATPEEVSRAEDRIRALRADTELTPGQKLFLGHVEGRILIERDRAAGQRALREVIAGAAKLRQTDIEARKAWSYSHQVLVLDAGRAGEFDAAITLLGAELERAAPASCLLAVAGQDERILFVARGPQGELRGEYQGQRTRTLREELPPVPGSLLEAFEGCDTVRVLAEPIFQGRPGLLAADRAWSYLVPRVGEVKAPAVTPPAKHVIVSDVEPPASLKLPHLLPWNRPPRPGEVNLRGPSATPGTVLAELTDATEVEFHAHGLIRSGFSDASFLALSPEPGGRFALTAGDLQGRSLRASPLVLLAACHANGGAWRYYAVWSLPAAFIQAGARAVVAPTAQVPDVEVGAVFQELLDRVEKGASPAQALRDTREAWLQKGAGRWVSDLVVFE
ncbi:CHAT domain-containing protein [Hyalangium versicolor]|uniref:CHAT domain-containing protein n=1 Tax=Hyalangium versicolor TaxID=2861190 RepID=UPI001CCBBE5C|nr:CHAT domain-containing protein [Hyalangium versicolor]